MNEKEPLDHEAQPSPQKQKHTLSVPSTTSNAESRDTVRFTAPSNSRSIRASSSAARRRSLPVSLINACADGLLPVGERKTSNRMADKCGEVVRLSVEKAIGIQSKPPSSQRTLNSTFWRFGKLEKSNDRPGASRPSKLGGSVSRAPEPA